MKIDTPPSEPELLPPELPPKMLSEDEQIGQAVNEGAAVAHGQAVAKGRAAIHRILQASDSEIRDRAFLLDCVCNVGISYQDWAGLAAFTDHTNPVEYGVLQIPTEFTDYLLLAGAGRPETAIEIGVFHGASAYISAAYFYRLNSNHQYTAVDVVDKLADFTYFAGILPIKKAVPCTSGHFAGQKFDLVLIDGDHSYDASRLDWLNIGRSSGVVAFHDINGAEYDHRNGGIRRTWKELKLAYRATRSVIEISHHSDWMGIGLIYNERPPWLA